MHQKNDGVGPSNDNTSRLAARRAETRALKDLVVHPVLADLFTLGSLDDQRALQDDIAANGIARPLTITGDGCASPPGTILGGRRRRVAGLAVDPAMTAPVVVVDGLTADQEGDIVIRENLADQLGRRLLPSERARLERVLIERYRRPSGHRSDLETSSGSRQGRTTDLVAAETGESRNAVVDRQTIFYSPLSPASLQKAVDAGKVAPTVAANIVRAAERDPDYRRAVEEGATSPDNATVASVRAKVEEAVAARLGGGGTPKAPAGPLSTAVVVGEDGQAQAILRGRLIAVVAPAGTRVEVKDVGPATKAQLGEQRPAVDTKKGVTKDNWRQIILNVLHDWSDALEGAALDDRTLRIRHADRPGSVTLTWFDHAHERWNTPVAFRPGSHHPVIETACAIGRVRPTAATCHVEKPKSREAVGLLLGHVKTALAVEGLLGDDPPRRWDPSVNRYRDVADPFAAVGPLEAATAAEVVHDPIDMSEVAEAARVNSESARVAGGLAAPDLEPESKQSAEPMPTEARARKRAPRKPRTREAQAPVADAVPGSEPEPASSAVLPMATTLATVATTVATGESAAVQNSRVPNGGPRQPRKARVPPAAAGIAG